MIGEGSCSGETGITCNIVYIDTTCKKHVLFLRSYIQYVDDEVQPLFGVWFWIFEIKN